MSKNAWSPFVAGAFGAETSFQVRAAGGPPATVVCTQHGQIIDAQSRRLLDWQPDEMAAADPTPAPAEPAPPKRGKSPSPQTAE